MDYSTNTSVTDNFATGRQEAYPSPWLLAASCLPMLLLSFFLMRDQGTKIPYLNPKKRFEWSSARAVQEIIFDARQKLYRSASGVLGKPFRVLSDVGDVIILPPQFGQEIRNDKRFSFTQRLFEDFQGRYAGFEAYKEATHQSGRLQNVVKLRLTKTLGKITGILSKEAETTIQHTLTDSKGYWHEVVLKEVILDTVSAMSGRIFVGERLGHNKQWLQTVIDYVELSLVAMQSMRMWPEVLRSIVVWFLPGPTRLRAYVRDAERLISAELKMRKEESYSAEYEDAIEWFAEVAKGEKYNPAVCQLILGSVAVHTTADLITQTVYDILQHPELIEPLREEVIRVIGEGGWKKTSLHNLKLMDSVLKESQRLKPAQIGSSGPSLVQPALDPPRVLTYSLVGMSRSVTANVELSDGTKLARGSNIAVSAERMWDPEVYENPLEFDGYRFFRERGGPNDAANQLVSTGISHMGFGHGMHSCPGRFFA
ncbi:cytochrome p450 monooxygenase, partial [Colletotrichum musicola]